MYGANNAAEMWKQLSDVKEPKGIHGVINAYRAMFRTYANEGDVTTGSPHSRNGSQTPGLGLSLEAGPSVTGV